MATMMKGHVLRPWRTYPILHALNFDWTEGHNQNAEEMFMTKLATLTGLALILTVSYATAQQNTMTAGRPSAVLTPDQRNAAWSKAVPSGDTLAQDAAPYIVNFAQVSTRRNSTSCGNGLVKNPQ